LPVIWQDPIFAWSPPGDFGGWQQFVDEISGRD
jgi:hypothetical protein